MDNNNEQELPGWVTSHTLSPDLQRKLEQSAEGTARQARAAETRMRMNPPFVVQEADAVVTPKELEQAIKRQERDLQYVRVSTGVLLLVGVLGALDLLVRAREFCKMLGVIRRRLSGDGPRLKGK